MKTDYRYGQRNVDVVPKLADLDGFVIIGRAKDGTTSLWSSETENTVPHFIREAAPELTEMLETA